MRWLIIQNSRGEIVMRSEIKKWFFFPFAVVIGYCLNLSIDAQVKPVPLVRPNKPTNYRYLVGKEIGMALKGDSCSVFTGIIQDAAESKITVSIKETLTDKKPLTDTLTLTETELLSDRLYLKSYSPKITTNFKKGNELIVFYCGQGEQKLYPFVTTDKEAFSGIKRSVAHFVSYKQNPEVLLDIPSLVETADDMIFLGYIVEFLSVGGALQHSDYTARVLSQLMQSDRIPEESFLNMRRELYSLILSNFTYPLTSDTRDTVLKSLVKLGSSNKRTASEAILVLARLANRGTVDLKPYLNPQDKIHLYENLRGIPSIGFSQKERGTFEKLLTRN